MPSGQTVGGAYDRIQSHEELCAERYRNIHASMGDLKSDLRLLIRGMAVVIITVLGWLAIQLWGTVVGGPRAASAATVYSIPPHGTH